MNYNLNLLLKRTVIRRTLTVFAFAFSSQFIFVENALGQNLKENNINYVAKDATINNVFKQLNKLTGFYFFYNESVLKDLRTVNIQIQKGSIEDILKSLSQQTGLYFKRMYLQPIITQYFTDNKSEIWSLSLIAHSKR